MAEEAGRMFLKILGALTIIDIRNGSHRFLPTDSSQLPTSLPGTAASLIPWHPQRPLRILQWSQFPSSLITQQFSRG